MFEIVAAIARMDMCAEKAHSLVGCYIAERFDEIMFFMEEMGYPGDNVVEIATRHILLKQHVYCGKKQAAITVERIMSEFQSDSELFN